MPLTAEQQADLDFQLALQNATENNRAANQAAAEATRTKLETLRMAKEVLVENRRTQAAADAVDITASSITVLATELNTFVNS